ncbi:MAG: chloride channel protein [Chloroflexia bacterium]|nr:chloride channel protein [Chloroflexia bacterium]
MDKRWLIGGSLLAVVIGVVTGLASALFLVTLDWATERQARSPWLLALLPLAGAGIAWAYAGIGKSAAGGNNLILDQIHALDGENRVPLRMFPLVLVATISTHLFGGSAGREGTAVQMGGAFAAWLARQYGLQGHHLRILLMCGISGGFSSVFGTPLAGTIFGMEVLALGGMRYDALIPCLVSAIAGDLTIRWLDVHHGLYAIGSPIPELSLSTVVPVAIAAVAFGLVSLLFSEATVGVERVAKQLVPHPVWRTFLGGFVVIAITLALGTRIYNGLSLPLLADAFSGGSVPDFAFLFKLVLTAVTLGVGFKGGEVTPLFVIGATLGVTLSGPLGLEPDFLAALGFVAVFGAAANTPVACLIMGAELFGASGIVHVGIAVFIAYTVSGHRGIYHSQRVLAAKHPQVSPEMVGASLHELRLRRPQLSWRRRRIVDAAAREGLERDGTGEQSGRH